MVLIGFGIVLNELRRVTGSVWPAALAHGAHNATWGLLMVMVTRPAPTFEYVGPQAGVVPTVMYGLLALDLGDPSRNDGGLGSVVSPALTTRRMGRHRSGSLPKRPLSAALSGNPVRSVDVRQVQAFVTTFELNQPGLR
jgi:hypothetical protein